MSILIDRYIEKKKENKIEDVIDEISDIFEYGELENDVCLGLSQFLINDVIQVEDIELQESILNAISNAAIYKNVAEYINIDNLVDNIDKFNISNLEYIFIIIGFSHNKKYVGTLEFYVNSSNESLSENAKIALKEIKSKVDSNKNRNNK
ncbi:hypothetical protein [Clostridium sp. C8-1-8]|uniref:hypothetical protein n=1 Tax=Clostridium sp. C8-1-8 TaxID=2698831 RepID=UPI00136F2BF4|nr:hypothetical protein [Clostridium sp. C8-1-8]